jgi:class 3 adenylate cyclase
MCCWLFGVAWMPFHVVKIGERQKSCLVFARGNELLINYRTRLSTSLALAALDAQRPALGDAVVEAAQAPIRERLRALQQKPAEQQRKQVTVLFADVSGFTAAVENKDAEDVAEAVNALWALVDRVIVAHGGVIDKHMGDAVMALWGGVSAQEDDPERAVLAALKIQQEIQEAGLRAPAGVCFAMRIAVHSGPVFLGAVGTTGEYTALGDTINTVSRLQLAAPVGGVLVSHETYRLVIGLFDMQPVEAIEAKGKSGPLQAYQVYGVEPRTFRQRRRGLEGIVTRMVGRDVELGFLQAAFHRTVQESSVQLVTVIGEAGIGKSRLLYEFEHWLEKLPEEI